MSESPSRCGFVALVGRPNVGKSTLLNTLIGEKISIVTPKPQTTRHRIVGVKNHGPCQILFVDTPGLRAGRQNLMGQTMNRSAEQSVADSDLALFVVDTGGIDEADRHALQRLVRYDVPALGVLNKIDRVKSRSQLLPALAELDKLHGFEAVVPVSALTGDNVDVLLDLIVERLPESPWLYPRDQVSDRGESFRAGELIREKLMFALDKEIPYGLSVEIERLKHADDGVEIDAIVWVERESQKPIVIGKQGHQIRDVGRAARLEMKAAYGKRVHLNLWVKVKKNWADSERSLQALGYEVPK